MTTKGKIFLGIGIIAVAGIGYYFYKKTKITSWQFDDNYWLKDAQNKLGFIGSKKPKLKVGDAIIIKQDAGAKHTEYDGRTTIQSIVRVDDKWVVSIPKMYRGASPKNAGVIVKA